MKNPYPPEDPRHWQLADEDDSIWVRILLIIVFLAFIVWDLTFGKIFARLGKVVDDLFNRAWNIIPPHLPRP